MKRWSIGMPRPGSPGAGKMTALWYIVGSLYVLGALALAFFFALAPVGFEDEEGFHLGYRPWSRQNGEVSE